NLEVDYDSLDEADADGLQIIDIREANELIEMPTPSGNARHIPMAQLLHGDAKLAPSSKYLLVCASGRRSYAAAEELRSRGFTDVSSWGGGVPGPGPPALSGPARRRAPPPPPPANSRDRHAPLPDALLLGRSPPQSRRWAARALSAHSRLRPQFCSAHGSC